MRWPRLHCLHAGIEFGSSNHPRGLFLAFFGCHSIKAILSRARGSAVGEAGGPLRSVHAQHWRRCSRRASPPIASHDRRIRRHLLTVLCCCVRALRPSVGDLPPEWTTSCVISNQRLSASLSVSYILEGTSSSEAQFTSVFHLGLHMRLCRDSGSSG